MYYCENCRILTDTICETCHRSTREAAADDPILLCKRNAWQAGMLGELLQQEGIPYERVGRLGGALTAIAGETLEEYTFYVPYACYEQSRDLLLGISTAVTTEPENE